MKHILLAAVLLISVKAFSQTFEGTIKWTIKMEITDPKQKAQLEAAQKKLNDPTTQAQIKEMQAKMNDPQFKAMMDSNPQMKAQIEKMVAGLQGGDMNSMIPKGLTVKIKNQNSLTKMEGGMFASEILSLNDKAKTYSLDRANKTYSVLNAPDEKEKTTKDADVKVTKTSETAKVLNYNCTKYIVDITSAGGTKMTQYIWATTEIKDFDLKSLAKQRFGKGGQRMFYESIDGVPLKIEMRMAEANMSMEATGIKKEALNASDFVIPADFKEVPNTY